MEGSSSKFLDPLNKKITDSPDFGFPGKILANKFQNIFSQRVVFHGELPWYFGKQINFNEIP